MIWSHNKCLSWLFPLHLNTCYIMSLYGHYKYSLFQCGDRLETSESDVHRRHILTSKVGPRLKGLRADWVSSQRLSCVILKKSVQFIILSWWIHRFAVMLRWVNGSSRYTHCRPTRMRSIVTFWGVGPPRDKYFCSCPCHEPITYRKSI